MSDIDIDVDNMRRWVSDFVLLYGVGWKDYATIRDVLRFAIEADAEWSEYKILVLCKVLSEKLGEVGGWKQC